MKVIVTPRAEADITHQYEWGSARFGERVAAQTFDRVRAFVEFTLADHPRIGKRVLHPDVFESWIPRTPFVVFYRIDDTADTVWVLAMFHHAQDRTDFEPDDGA